MFYVLLWVIFAFVFAFLIGHIKQSYGYNDDRGLFAWVVCPTLATILVGSRMKKYLK